MLTREQRKERNQNFWEAFRKFMKPYRSSNGRRINWINYPSDVKDIYIRMEADNKGARLCLDIQPKDEGVRSVLFEQMTELRKVLESHVNWEGIWNEHYHNKEGHSLSRISWEKDGIDFYKDEDWPEIMNFLKDRIIEFDVFYQEFKDILIALAE
jgi:hypothetical protein